MTKWIIFKSLILPVVTIAMLVGNSDLLYGSEEAFGFSSDSGGSAESYLGVDTRDVSPDRLTPLQLKEEKGVEVTMVDQDAPAGKAGLKEHDVILTVNGTEVESVEQLRRLIHEIPAGRLISLGLSRNGQALTLKAQLAERKRGFAMAWPQVNPKMSMPVVPPIPPMPEMDIPVSIVVVHSSTRSGLMVENLTPQLGDFFGVKEGRGILVRSVEKGSRGERAGFHAGDVIVKVNQEKINDSGDFTHALNFRRGSTAIVTILRDKKQLNLTLTLPDHGPSGDRLDESSNIPIGDARTQMEIFHAQSEIARMQPEIQRAIEMHTADIRRIKPEIERTMKFSQEEVKREMRELQRRMNENKVEIRRAIHKAFQDQADI